MPIKRGIDSNGPYYSYGDLHRYYYKLNDPISREIAKEKARKQGAAIHVKKIKIKIFIK